MKKRLLGLGIGLGLVVAMLFSFAACAEGKDPVSENSIHCERLYWEISESVDKDTKLQEHIFSMDELQKSVEYQRDASPFAEVDEAFFEEYSLVIYRFPAPYSGGDLSDIGHSIPKKSEVSLSIVYECGLDPNAGSILVLVELSRNIRSVSVSYRYDNYVFPDNLVRITLTNEATFENIFHDYTVEDFPEINAESISENGGDSCVVGIGIVRRWLEEDPTGSTIPDEWKTYQRHFTITLKEKSKENVLRVVNLLMQRDDIASAFPSYSYSGDGVIIG